MSKKKPAYTLHKPSGQARVRIKGKDHYLGVFDSPESRDRYDELIAEWFAEQGDLTFYSLTIDEVALQYLKHAEVYYRKNGKPTREVNNIKGALRPLIEKYGAERVREFGPVKLRHIRDSLINKPDARIKSGDVRTVSRQYINGGLRRIRRMFKWAVGQQLIPLGLYQSLQTVEGLKKGRTMARESKGISCVDDAHVDAVLPHVSAQVAAMIELQRLTGMRPGEAVEIRPADITFRTDGLWSYRPPSHKNEHHDLERLVLIGPKAQKVLHPWLSRDADAHCFSAREAVEQRRRVMRAQRKTRVQPSQSNRRKPNPKRAPGDLYSENAYAQAIRRGIDKVNKIRREKNLPLVPHWTPNQLRHNRATLVRQRFGIEGAQVVLGHSDPRTTAIYAERDYARAAEIMREIG